VAFVVEFIGEYAFEQRINELLFAWENDIDFEFSTSGSTGEPKRIIFTKQQVLKSIESTVKRLDLKMGQEHIFLCLDPNYVAGAIMFLRAYYLACPITIIMPSAKVWINISTNHPYTFASFVPLQIADNSFDEQKFARIKNVLIGGAALNSELKNKVIAKGNNVFHTYGMTETLTHIALMDLNNSEWYVVLEGYVVKKSASGTLVVEAPFLSNELVTNDLVEMNDNGSFKVSGRVDFVINSGAFKVSPEKLELKIFEWVVINNEDYGNLLVFGKPDSNFGETICLVTEKKLTDYAFSKLQDYLKQRLHKYEIPNNRMVFKPFLLTNSGKLDRKGIIKHLISN
jgi:O-succinylbenzoic acid--CoA ligase